MKKLYTLLLVTLIIVGFMVKPSILLAAECVEAQLLSESFCTSNSQYPVQCDANGSYFCCTTTTECNLQQSNLNDALNTGSDLEGITNEQFNAFNPLVITGSELANDLSTPGGILSQVLDFAFPAAGLILFVMIFWGGFEMLSGAASKKSMDAGKQRITAAVVGFLLLFISFWLVRILEAVFGISVF